jgi:hypothetical protein
MFQVLSHQFRQVFDQAMLPCGIDDHGLMQVSILGKLR